MKNFTQKFIVILALLFTMSFTVSAQEIGDQHAGGIVFQINEDGTGLVADLQDLGQMDWADAMDLAIITTSQGYDDWYLPSIEELELMYNTIGQGADNAGGFSNTHYWSSLAYGSGAAWNVSFINGSPDIYGEHSTIRVRVIRSVTFEEDENTEDDTADSFLNLPEGWSIFGYTCLDSVDAMVGFSSISDKIEIVKDEWGLSYLPSWDFNAMGSLQFSEGYQIKMLEEVTDFQFCDAVVPEDGITQADVDSAYDNGAASVIPEDGVSQVDVDAAVAAVEASYEGWCASDIDNDGICDEDEFYDECGVQDGDNSTCIDCAGVVNGTSEDLGCGCGNPAAQAGYDCDGEVLSLQIGDEHAGGIVFQINEDGTGLVADLQDLGDMNWDDAMDLAIITTSQGYDDWYLPSIEELELMYNTIGQGTDNAGGFGDNRYWSSSEYDNNSAWNVYFFDGGTHYDGKSRPWLVRIIRAF
jgi:hypothetical protein